MIFDYYILIGLTYFRVELELSNAGQSDHHVMSQHIFGLNKIHAIQWWYSYVRNDQKQTKVNKKVNICENKWYLIGKIE